MAVTLHDTSGKLGKSRIPLACRNHISGCFLLLMDNGIYRHLPVMPDSTLCLAAIYEAAGVERIVIEEGVDLLDLLLKLCIGVRVCLLWNLEVDMELRPRRLSVLHLHVVPGEGDRIRDIFELLCECFRCHPDSRVLGVIIVTVHDDALGREEVLVASIVALVLGADMIVLDSGGKCIRIRDLVPVRVEAVLFITRYPGGIKNQFHHWISRLWSSSTFRMNFSASMVVVSSASPPRAITTPSVSPV